MLAHDERQDARGQCQHLNKAGAPFGWKEPGHCSCVGGTPRLHALQGCVSLARGLVQANQEDWPTLVLGPILGSNVP